MGITLINPKNQKTYGGDDEIPDENYYNGVFFSNPALAAMFRENKWSTTLNVGDPDENVGGSLKKSKGIGRQSAEGANIQSGNLRRTIKAKSRFNKATSSLISTNLS